MSQTPDPAGPARPDPNAPAAPGPDPVGGGATAPVTDPAPVGRPSDPPVEDTAAVRRPTEADRTDQAGRAGTRSSKADDPLRGSRTGGVYAALVAFGIVLILLVIFIAQNTDSAPVRFLGWEGSAPVAVLLLIAVAAGLLLAGAAASARIIQLRRRVKKERKR